MGAIWKKELFRIVTTKLKYIIILLLLGVALSPLSDYRLRKSTILHINGSDYIHLLLCGASGFFPTLLIMAIVLCIGFILHKEFKEETILYEPMNGLNIIQSVISRFFIASIVALLQIILLIILWMICSIKNGFHIEGNIYDFCLKFVCLLVSGIHVGIVTLITSFVFQNGHKAIVICFLRYILGGLLWGVFCGGMDQKIIIQCRCIEPVMNIRLIFEDYLIMDNYWIILSMTILSLLTNTMIWLLILVKASKNKDY